MSQFLSRLWFGLLKYFLSRLREPSTIAGLLIVIAGAAKWEISQEEALKISNVIVTLLGFLLALTPDGYKLPWLAPRDNSKCK